ncbi:putative phloem protein [Helianthus annuus]|nr:putative phloem protein [Helianthus annuus]
MCRFQRVVKMMDISDLKIQIKIKTQFLTPNVIYGAHLVFKFCDPRKFSSNLKYVNLKYKMGGEILHAYFATCRDDVWMMIELCRFIPHKKNINFEVLLESLSRYYCGTGEIYVEGIHFQPINNTTLEPELYEKLKGVQEVLKSNLDYGQQVPVDYDEINRLDDDEKLLSVSKANEKNCHMLPAKMVLYESSDVKCFNWKSLAEPESRFLEVAELISHQVFQIRCKIEIQKLSPDTDYACHLVFKLSQQCHGLHCPVRVRDVLNRKKKEFKFVYFRSPRLVNLYGNEKVPKLREDGLMEVIMWEFNSGNKDHVPMSLKLRCYEGTMSGLIVYGVEFRPI